MNLSNKTQSKVEREDDVYPEKHGVSTRGSGVEIPDCLERVEVGSGVGPTKRKAPSKKINGITGL
jgi:hypothetical protein